MSNQPPLAPQGPDPQSPEAIKARNRRSVAIALALGAFVVLVFVISLVRMAAHGV